MQKDTPKSVLRGTPWGTAAKALAAPLVAFKNLMPNPVVEDAGTRLAALRQRILRREIGQDHSGNPARGRIAELRAEVALEVPGGSTLHRTSSDGALAVWPDPPCPPSAGVASSSSAPAEHTMGHRVFLTGTTYWCNVCGAHATSRARGLARACRGPPSDRHQRYALRLLLRGKHPSTRAPLGDCTRRVSLAELGLT